jgi:hypothetical protein
MVSSESASVLEENVLVRLSAELPRLLPNLMLGPVRRAARTSRGIAPDAIVTARVGNLEKELILEVKSLGEPRIAERAITQLRRLAAERPKAYPVLVAPYLSERARELLRAEGIGYIDLVGDAYLRFGPVLVDRVGTEGRRIEKRSLRSLFAPKATRVIRTLLSSPKEGTTITRLATGCRMSPAGVFNVIDLLETKGFVTRRQDRGIELREPERLLREWARNWSMERNGIERYFSFERTPQSVIAKLAETAKRRGVEYALTGMAGASLRAPFVRFGEVWLYAGKGREQLVHDLGLRRVGEGANVVLLEPYDPGVFAGAHEVTGGRVVSDIQLFVDLYNDPARGQEQAEELFARRIRFERNGRAPGSPPISILR